jgi:hypothetical protein
MERESILFERKKKLRNKEMLHKLRMGRKRQSRARAAVNRKKRETIEGDKFHV